MAFATLLYKISSATNIFLILSTQNHLSPKFTGAHFLFHNLFQICHTIFGYCSIDKDTRIRVGRPGFKPRFTAYNAVIAIHFVNYTNPNGG